MSALLSPSDVKQKLERERDKVCFVDVRSEDEFRFGHVPGAICVPLDQIENGGSAIPRDRLVILSCQGGRRSARAREILLSRGYSNLLEMEGGFSAWLGQGFPVNQLRKSIPVVRQVMVAAGSLTIAGTALGLTLHPTFFVLPAFMGVGLTFSGLTGWCGLAYILERMPWNR